MTEAVSRNTEWAYALLVAGAALIWPPLALLVAGAFLLALAIIADRRSTPTEAPK